MLIIFLRWNILPTEFGYSGIDYVCTALCIVIIFNAANNIVKKSTRRKSAVHIATNYTLGIYCMHRLIGNVVVVLLGMLHVPVGGFFYCNFIYICCYCISLIVSKIPILRGFVL